MQKQYNDVIEINPISSPKATVIWLHGLGASGYDFVNITAALNLPRAMAVRFIFPHAPMRKITINGGYKMRAWFDIYALNPNAPQDELGMKESLIILEQLIAKEISLGIPSERIIIAGFSQGAAVAMHAALSLKYKFAGILALSGFLLPKAFPSTIDINNTNTPILMLHGKYDTMVSLNWAESARDMLIELNFSDIKLQTYDVEHSVCEEEIRAIALWMQSILKHE